MSAGVEGVWRYSSTYFRFSGIRLERVVSSSSYCSPGETNVWANFTTNFVVSTWRTRVQGGEVLAVAPPGHVVPHVLAVCTLHVRTDTDTVATPHVTVLQCHTAPYMYIQVCLVSRNTVMSEPCVRAVFLNRRTAARHRAPASIIPGRERFCWNLSF